MKLRGPNHHHSRAAPNHRLANLKSLFSSMSQLRQLQRQLFLHRHLRRLFSPLPFWRPQLSLRLQLFSRQLLSWRLQLFSQRSFLQACQKLLLVADRE
jgi:hypothetical protein